jgi:lipoyl(octanoyl) transferase
MLKHALKPAPALERPTVAWVSAPAPVPYEAALEAMDARAKAVADGTAPDCVWLLEHPPLYTAGTSATDEELLEPGRFPVFKTGRGGRYTYHGPGQRIAYVMLDLSARGRDVKAYVTALEAWLIATLARLGVKGERRPGAVGIFVGDAKIASIGVRVRRWVTLHGVSLNVDPNLEHFSGIVPCGLHGTKVTSLAALGAETDRSRVDEALRASFSEAFSDLANCPSKSP